MTHIPSYALRHIVGGLIVAVFLATHAHAQVLLKDSVKTVKVAPNGIPSSVHEPQMTRATLTAVENGAPFQFEVALKMRNLADLEARVARGEQISRKEMAEKYEPPAADYTAVAAWLTGQGLKISRSDRHHLAIFATGNIGQVQQALKVSFGRVSVEGQEYTSAVTAPSVPAGVAPLLVGINGLQPHIQAHRHLIRKQAFPNASGGQSPYYPSQLAQAYNVTPLYTDGINGTGQTIAIVIDTFPNSTDLKTFWSVTGVKQSINNIQFIQAVPGTLPAASGEETLDTEWSSSMAPSAKVRVYAATSLENSLLDETYAKVLEDVTNDPALGIHQMSMSYGLGETYTTASQVDTDDEYFVELAAAGVTVFASSGDSGSTPGDGASGDESGTLQASSPATDPNVTGVGGTSLVLNSTNGVTSESVWNDSPYGGAGGGGISIYFSRPSWQTGTGVSGSKRECPDVAAAGDPNYGALIVLDGEQQQIGGTSWSSPTWAGMCALLNQARIGAGGSAIGILGPQIYPLLSGTNYSANYNTDFRDIISGNNATANSGGKYAATVGYDCCSGLGAPNLENIASLLIGGSASGIVTIQMPAEVQQVVPGQSASFTVTVSGTTASYQWQRMPIGQVGWSNLTDDSTYMGSGSNSLTIANTTAAMSGDQFQCLVTYGTNSVTTNPASALVVDTPLQVSTLAGSTQSTGRTNGTGSGAHFNYPSGTALDGSGNIYVADYTNNEIRMITPGGAVTTPFGSTLGFSGSTNGLGNIATFNNPGGIAIDGSNNIYIADSGNNLIRKITGTLVSTLAGAGGGQFNVPVGVAVDAAGNVYVADSGNDVIRKVTPGGTVSILAGEAGQAGYANGAAIGAARFNDPTGVAVDSQGDVYVADFGNMVVREISGGTVTTVAGQAGDSGYLDGLGANALFNAPIGVAVDGSNNVYIADAIIPGSGSTSTGNDLVRKLSPAGVVSTLAGEAGFAGAENGTGTTAQFYGLQGLAVSGSGLVFIADTYNQLIRQGTPNGSIIVANTSTIVLSGNLNFGNVATNQTAASELTITNSGSIEMAVSGIALPNGYTADWTAGIIPAQTSQTVNIIFAPQSSQSYDGTLTVTSNATDGDNHLGVSGTGVAALNPPMVNTTSATSLGAVAVTLNGEVNPEGSLTNAYFEYGTSGTYGSTTSGTSAGSGGTNVPFNATLARLLPLTIYYYRAVGSNNAATVYGTQKSFSTPAFTTVPVASVGDAAVGVDGGQFASFGNPAINTQDYVAFQALLANGAGGVNATDNSGIWAEDGTGTRDLVARTGGVAPGAGSAVYQSLSSPVYNDNDAVAFLAKLKVAKGAATAANANGIWSNIGRSLTLVARQGSPAVGISKATFKAFDQIALPDQGKVVFLASASNGKEGIWAGSSAASLQMIIAEGGALGGKTIQTLGFLPTLPYVAGQSHSFSQSTGALIMNASFTDKTTGIIEIAGTTPQLIAQSGSAAPGVSGGEFEAFGSPTVNASGNIAFAATLSKGAGGVSATDNTGIWANDNTATLQLVARTGSAAPGTTSVFTTLSTPVYNDNEAVAFRGALKTGKGLAVASQSSGIWANNGGTLQLVALQGSQAAGCPQGVTFQLFNAFALPNEGGAIMLATLNNNPHFGVTASTNLGIWAVDTTGNMQLIARKGNIVNGSEITSFSFLPILKSIGGQGRNFNYTTGDLIYQAGYSNKTSGLSGIIFP